MNNLHTDEFSSEIEKLEEIKLPIFQSKNAIIEAVKNHQFVIIHGQTGCGKTTQVPKYLYKEGLHEDGMIGITQPRRIAAVSMAKRVAEEMNEVVGKVVGYEVRFENKSSAATKIKYMTDGILLNEYTLSKNLKEYNIIMIDEAHERSVNSDVLLGLLKGLAEKRKDLKIIISSATISVDKFVKYFEDAEVILVESRMFDVDVIYHKVNEDYIGKAIEIIKKIHIQETRLQEQGNATKSDILVFLTGKNEIDMCCDGLQNITDIVPKPLYGSIDFNSQKEVFEPVRPYETKVVIATNIAETSITIEGIKYVIDCGYVRQNSYNLRRGIEILEDVRISKAQAEQRKGRAGRTQPGTCHRLYNKLAYESFKDEVIPEIKRKNLSEIYLKLTEMNIILSNFDFIDSPKPEELVRSKKELILLGLLTEEGKTTNFGKSVATFPLDPILGKILMASFGLKCTTDVIRIIAMFSFKMEQIFRKPKGKAEIADAKRRLFYHPSGDHLTLLNVYNRWKEQKDPQNWCFQNFIDNITMQSIEQVIKQIHIILKRNKMLIVEKATDGKLEDIKKCFITGYFRNICIKQKWDQYIRALDDEVFNIGGDSILKDARPKIILFNDALKTNKCFASGIMQLEENFLRENFKKELALIKFPEDIDAIN